MRYVWFLACLLIAMAFSGPISSLFAQDVTSIIHDVSDVADGSIEQARLEAQRQATGAGPAYRSFKKGDTRFFSGKYTPPELPGDKNDRFVYGLAMFSDDGCDVTIKGSTIHQRLGKGQHLPNLGDSFHLLPIVLTPGEPVDITVRYLNTIYLNDPDSPEYPDIDGCTLFLFLVPGEIVPDHNRDGTIDNKDRGKVTMGKPFRWWLNDDNDNGDLSNEDRPLGIGNPSVDAALGSNHIDGTCDLIDWFPVFLDLKQVLEVLPPDQCQYHLKHEDAALNVVYTDLKPEDAGDYLRDGETADSLKNAQSYIVFANGTTQITTEFLNKIKNDGKGVILLEGGNITEKPLYVQVFKSGQKLAELAFELKIDGVEQMYRWINLRTAAGQSVGRTTDLGEPGNYPDKETNGKMFVFVHGYNVSEQQSRGWCAEGFKRLYQTGSRAMYSGVSWHGDSSQIPVIGQAPDYWENVTNAFKSAAALATAVNSLPGSTKVSAAHSLGSMVVSSAIKDHGMAVSKHFLFDAAVAIETYDPTALDIDQMRNPDWSNYVDANAANPRRLWASEWYQLFDNSDGRNKLTWRNRFGALTVAYNFYSSGEDVLNNSNGQVPLLPSGAERVWAMQEMMKGTSHPGAVLTLDSNGGWGFNGLWNVTEEFSDPEHPELPPEPHSRKCTPVEARAITSEQLKTQPFFKHFQDSRLMDASQGSAAASEYLTRAKVLGDAIPSLSFAVGRNPVPAFGQVRNVDLMTQKNDDGGWPQARLSDPTKVTETGEGRWLHGDTKDVAYRYNYLLWKSWVDLGELK